jgi:bifunctional UDP-N-acetylglucosamine pyrophosphorylase/glucosamine-1-phosphate N-acetyltransferase
MALRGEVALEILERIDNKNAKGEFYLTDAVTIADGMALESVALETRRMRCAASTHGRNSPRRKRDAAAGCARPRSRPASHDRARDGVPLADTKFGRDVTIEPNVVFGPGCVVEDDAVIHAFSHLAARRSAKALGRPYARLRPGAKLGQRSRVGNFVEVKEAEIGEGAKANHLAYIGDGRVGAGANIGAGTIFCNYDGEAKHRTDVGKGAFIGSNSALVAPVKVGDNAYVGSGSVITENVPSGALALGRGRQVNKTGWAAGKAARRQGGQGGQGGQEACGKKADEGGAEEEEENQTLTLALMIA